MPHRRHHHRTIKQDSKTHLVRLLSALIGLTFGFAGGRMFSTPVDDAKNLVLAREADTGQGSEIPRLPAIGTPVLDRVLACVRMDEDSLGGVLAALQEDWRRTAAQPDSPGRHMLYLRLLFSRWTDLNGRHALNAALTVKNSRFSSMALEAVMTEWGLRDPGGASNSVTTIPWIADRQRAMLALVRAGMRQGPVEVLALIQKVKIIPQPLLLEAAGAEWMHRDSSFAQRRLMEVPGMETSLPAGGALAQWLLEDPAAFVAWRRADPAQAKSMPRLRFSEAALTPGRLTRLARVLAVDFGSLDAGTAWLAEAGGSSARPLISAIVGPRAAADAELKSWQEKAAAMPPVDSARGWLPRLAHYRDLAAIAARYAAADPAAALQWLASLPAEEMAEGLAPIAAQAWLDQAPVTAPPQLVAGDLSNSVFRAAAVLAVDRMVRTDPRKSLESLTDLKLDAAAVQSLQSAALLQLSSSDPAAMLDWLAAHPGMKVPASTITAALKSLAITDAPGAVQRLRRVNQSSVSIEAIPAIFSVWVQNDRDEALQFLHSLPDGKERDAAILALLSSDLEMRDPFFAGNLLPECFDEALHLQDDTQRREMLRAVLQRMRELKLSADSSINHRSLRAADREAILKQL